MLRNDAIIIAHHHTRGILRSDTIELLQNLSTTFKKVMLISTNLDSDQLKLIPPSVEVVIRENYGYDFFSYRMGILTLLPNEYDHIYVMNTSFVCVNYGIFEENVLNAKADDCVFGISQNIAFDTHLQSYFFAIPSSVFHRNDFINWWLQLAPINNREQVILTYEIGFSQFLRSKKIKIASLHPLTQDYDQTMVNWKEICLKAGIIKISLIKQNPLGSDLSYLYELAQDPKVALILNQALEN